MKRRVCRICLYGVLLLASFCCLVPFFWLIRSSFMSIGQIFEMPPKWIPRPFTFNNYKDAFSTLPLFLYFKNTMCIVFLNMLGVLISSSFCAYGFARIQWRGKNAVFTVLLSTIMLPGSVTLIPTFIMWTKLGFSNSFVPLTLPAWFGGGIFNIFLLRQFFNTIPRALDEASYIDGANHFVIYTRIILPLCKPALSVVALFSFMGSWNDVMGPLLYLNRESKFTLALGLKQFVSLYSAQWGLLMAASTAAVLPVIIVYVIGQKYFIEGIAMTGIKG